MGHNQKNYSNETATTTTTATMMTETDKHTGDCCHCQIHWYIRRRWLGPIRRVAAYAAAAAAAVSKRARERESERALVFLCICECLAKLNKVRVQKGNYVFREIFILGAHLNCVKYTCVVCWLSIKYLYAEIDIFNNKSNSMCFVCCSIFVCQLSDTSAISNVINL